MNWLPKFRAKLEEHFWWLLWSLLIFIPLYPKFPLANVTGTFVAIRIEDILIFLVIFIWLVIHLPRLKYLFKESIFQPFLLFWTVGGLSLISGIFITHSVSAHLGVYHWLRRIEYMSLFMVAATSLATSATLKSTMKILVAITILIVIYGFGQIWLGFPVISTTNSEFSKGLVLSLTEDARVNSTFAGHYDLAVYLSIVAIIFLSYFLYCQGITHRFFILLVTIPTFTLLGLTASRISFLAAFLGSAMLFWLNKKRVLLVALSLVLVSLLVLVPDLRHRFVATLTVNILGGGGEKFNPPPGRVTIFTPANKLPKESRVALMEKAKKEATNPSAEKDALNADIAPGEPINSTELGVYRSFGIRLKVEWPRALNAFYKNPLLGTGYSSISLATDNDYLRSLGETGLLGTLGLGLVFLAVLKRARYLLIMTSRFERAFLKSIMCSVGVVLATGLFIDVLESSKVAEIFWLLLGMALARREGE